MKEKMTERVYIRLSPTEKMELAKLANLYSKGNISAYVVGIVLYGGRKFIQREDFEFSARRVKENPSPFKKKTKQESSDERKRRSVRDHNKLS
jgi:hypothetical protein